MNKSKRIEYVLITLLVFIGMCIGIFMYLLALIGAAKLIELRKAKQLKKAKK